MPFLLLCGLTFAVFTWAILWRNSSLLIPTRWRGPRASRRVALTFDDGPDPRITPAVLDSLARQNAKATFFCIGQAARRNPELMARIHREGHLIANHSYEHDWRMNFWHPGRVARSLAQAGRTLARTTGAMPRFYRAPVGIKSPAQALMGGRMGLEFTGWSRSARDGGLAALRTQDLARLAEQARPGEVILVHDGKPGLPDDDPAVLGTARAFATGLDAAIVRLRERGFEPVRLDEMFGVEGYFAKAARKTDGRLGVPKSFWSGMKTTLRGLILEHASPFSLALAMGLGVFVGCTPFFGLHLLMGMVLAIKLRMNKLAVFVGTNISNPVTVTPVIFWNIQIGCRMLTGHWLPLSLNIFRNQSLFAFGNRMLLYWVAGFPLATTALSLLTIAACYPIFFFARKAVH